jgi:hypothetical protein
MIQLFNLAGNMTDSFSNGFQAGGKPSGRFLNGYGEKMYMQATPGLSSELYFFFRWPGDGFCY